MDPSSGQEPDSTCLDAVTAVSLTWSRPHLPVRAAPSLGGSPESSEDRISPGDMMRFDFPGGLRKGGLGQL